MKNILAIALLLASAAEFPVATPALADSSADPLCRPDAPEGYKRPGGYCEQLDQGSLVKDTDGCDYQIVSMIALRQGDVVLVADNCPEIEALV